MWRGDSKGIAFGFGIVIGAVVLGVAVLVGMAIWAVTRAGT